MDHLLTLIRFDVFHPTFRAAVIAATGPNVNPLLSIIRTTVVVNELLLRHFLTSEHHNENYLARG